tara:strand:+ start:1639 stop:1815 length:177 start_codon:yes stop_codon:yes gene_type:complete
MAISPAYYSPAPTSNTSQEQAFMNKFEQAFKFKQLEPNRTKEQTFYELFKKFENSSKK